MPAPWYLRNDNPPPEDFFLSCESSEVRNCNQTDYEMFVLAKQDEYPRTSNLAFYRIFRYNQKLPILVQKSADNAPPQP